MKTSILMLCLVFAAPAMARADGHETTLSQLLEWMSQGGKHTFVYDENVATFYRNSGTRMVPEAKDSTDPYATGIDILRTGGIAAVPLEKSGVVRLVPANLAIGQPLRLCASTQELPVADEFCSLTIPFRNASPQTILFLVQSQLTDSRQASVNADARTITVSGYAAVLRRIAELVRAADVERPWEEWRIKMAIVEGRMGGKETVPAGFEKVGLPDATGRSDFRVVEDAITVIDAGHGDPGRSSNPVLGRVRFQGSPDLVVEFFGVPRDGIGLTLEQFVAFNEPAAPNPGVTRVLAARPFLRDGEWKIAGSIPGGKDGSILVLVLRADRVK